MLQDVGVSWEWKDDADWQSMATEQEQLAELMTAWLTLSADLRVAILAIVRSAGASPSQRISHCPGNIAVARASAGRR